MDKNWRLVNIDADGSLPAQPQVAARMDRRIDLCCLEQELRLWPDRGACEIARDRIAELRAEAGMECPWITFIGTGDLNYLSAFLIESLAEALRPLHVVLVDNHPDWFQLPPRYHCGNWIGALLRHPWIASVTLIGQASDDLSGWNFYFAPTDDLLSGRLAIYPLVQKQARIPLLQKRARTNELQTSTSAAGTTINFATVQDLSAAGVASRLESRLAGGNVYLCIDKDVLAGEHASTDWDQGQMALSTLLGLVRTVAHCGNLVGVDICGERAGNDLAPFLKRLDAGRLAPGRPAGDTATNEATNLALLETLSAISRTLTGTGHPA